MEKEAKVVYSFMDGFAKQAEALGATPDDVKFLLGLHMNLSQASSRPDKFAEGFSDVVSRI